jgi:glycosyltransferase involved in cell wall biosynthesis
MKILPYQIEHIQVNENEQLNVLPLVGKRYYYVFWWNHIPLGHLYVEEKGIDNFHDAVLEAILPTLKKYDTNETFINEVQASYSSNKYSEFVNLVEKILYKYLNINIPSRVEVSIIICTRNRSESLRKCLEKINQQTCMPSEIIVVDNAPSDNSTMEVVKAFNNVDYYKEERPGLSIARNLGVKLAKYPIIAYTDDDVEVDKLWTYRVWESFLSNDIAAITGLVIASSLETESQQIFEKHWGFNKGYQDICFVNYFEKRSNVPRVWEIGAGANMAFRRDIIREVNYFDERLGAGASGCSEDSELWFRILVKGYKIHYNPRAVVFHEHRKQMNQLKKQLFSYMRGHVSSLLIQDKENKQIGYKNYVYNLLKYYLLLLRIGFPNYQFRYRTLWSEIKGIALGIKFYINNKNKPALAKKSV